MNASTSVESSPEKGPASLREALQEAFDEAADSTAAEDFEEIPATDDEAQPEDDVKAEAEAQPSEDQSQGEPEVIHAPEHWSAEDRAVFDELPSAAQKSWLRREKEYEKGIQKKAEESKALLEAIGPYRDFLKMRGIDEPTAIRTWVAAQQILDTDPVNGLKFLIQQYGPQVASALKAEFGQQNEPSGKRDDPDVAKLRQEISVLRNQNKQIETQYHTERQQQAYQQVQNFREETDANGQPVHPFFDEVQDKMRGLLLSGSAQDLQDAYEQAVWTHPKYRESYAEQQRKAAQQEEAKRRQEAANRAKKTARSVNGKGSIPTPAPKKRTMREDLLAAWDQSIKGEL